MRKPLAALAALVTAASLGVIADPASARDDQPPVVAVNPSMTFSGRLSDSTKRASVPGTVTWTASDPDGICVQTAYIYHYDFGTGDIDDYGINLFSDDRSLRLDYRFKDGYAVAILADDCVGNVDGSDGHEYWPGMQQENKADYSRGWVKLNSDTASRGAVRTPTRAKGTVKYHFTGNSLGLVSNKARNRGTARFFVDGIGAGRVDLSAARKRNRAVVFSWVGEPGKHILTVKTRGRVDIDAFLTLRRPRMMPTLVGPLDREG